MGISKTLGSVKRFGARYGRTSRHKVGRIEHEQRKKHMCPYCRKNKAKRVSAGIWYCDCCNSKFTGRAYVASSDQKQTFIKKEAEEEKFDDSILQETTKIQGQKYREAKVEKVKTLQDDDEFSEEPRKASKPVKQEEQASVVEQAPAEEEATEEVEEAPVVEEATEEVETTEEVEEASEEVEQAPAEEEATEEVEAPVEEESPVEETTEEVEEATEEVEAPVEETTEEVEEAPVEETTEEVEDSTEEKKED